MTDVHDPATRSRNMAAIRGKNSRPELQLRSALHRLGFRFRLHGATLPGRPDLVFPRYRAVLFVHGCFFHRHECAAFRWPHARAAFWRTKINGNAARDRRSRAALLEAGWRVGVVWECTLRKAARIGSARMEARVAAWLRAGRRRLEV